MDQVPVSAPTGSPHKPPRVLSIRTMRDGKVRANVEDINKKWELEDTFSLEDFRSLTGADAALKVFKDMETEEEEEDEVLSSCVGWLSAINLTCMKIFNKPSSTISQPSRCERNPTQLTRGDLPSDSVIPQPPRPAKTANTSIYTSCHSLSEPPFYCRKCNRKWRLAEVYMWHMQKHDAEIAQESGLAPPGTILSRPSTESLMPYSQWIQPRRRPALTRSAYFVNDVEDISSIISIEYVKAPADNDVRVEGLLTRTKTGALRFLKDVSFSALNQNKGTKAQLKAFIGDTAYDLASLFQETAGSLPVPIFRGYPLKESIISEAERELLEAGSSLPLHRLGKGPSGMLCQTVAVGYVFQSPS